MIPATLRLACVLALSGTMAGAQTPEPLAALNREVAIAERALHEGERELADSHYRSALLEGWMLTGAIESADGRLADAREAFTRASGAAASTDAAQQALATVEMQQGDTKTALGILARLAVVEPHNMPLRRLLAQAYIASGQPEAAVQELATAHTETPGDLETTFALASGYLRVKKSDKARALFATIEAARPIPQTYVLIGRAYRDAGQYDLATAALRKALAMDPHVRHAHYDLGMVAVMSEGVIRIDEAIREFRAELQIAPDDPAANLRLGMALVEARREPEALSPLEAAIKVPEPAPEAFQYLGRVQLALGHAGDAVVDLQKALALAKAAPPDIDRLGRIHYQLALALRTAGRTADADAEFADAQRVSAKRATSDREQLATYLSDRSETTPGSLPALALKTSALARTTTAERAALKKAIAGTLARIYLNLGIMQAQAERFRHAATLLESAAALDPAFPQVQYSLGVAYFSAKDYAKAAPALERAIDADQTNTAARRMLALASMNTGRYARAVQLLAGDPERETDPSLEYAYGVSLVRSDRAAEATALFSRLLATHADSPEINVVLGEAHAQEGDFEGAIAALERAIALKADVADAHAALGLIYLKQGQLAKAAAALQTELAHHPENVRARETLAAALELDGQPDEALGQLREVLRAQPDYADARYLMGKILLARGDAAGAVDHLEIAARLAPADANIHYQLAQAYQKLGRPQDASAQFDLFQQLKAKQRRGGSR
ncbi:MAG TPA: tetratricopeptide repeat protein [Vicinamibacterales bacterium]|nr:tetratricopeptide repeat protein [Vicinamibacterales bacterium]